MVSVGREPVVERAGSNYNRISVAAINQTADAGGTAPGDFSDVLTGGHYLLEDGTGALLLEDGSGYYLQEGTSFAYRHLQVRDSQNQDGSVSTHGSLETFETGFAAGQSFLLTSGDLSYSAKSFTITNVTTTFVGANPPTAVYLIEFGDAYQTLQLAGGGVLTRQGSQAAIQAGVLQPAGLLAAPAQVTTNQTGITTVVDLTGLSVTVTVVSGRRIRITGQIRVEQMTGAGLVDLAIQEGATILTHTYHSFTALASEQYGVP